MNVDRKTWLAERLTMLLQAALALAAYKRANEASCSPASRKALSDAHGRVAEERKDMDGGDPMRPPVNGIARPRDHGRTR